MRERQPKRKHSVYLAGHRDGWNAIVTLLGINPESMPWTPPPDKRPDKEDP